MPIMASHGRSDARGTAQLLASMALDCIENPATAREQVVELNNVYRLLQSYRTNPFFGVERPSPPVSQSATERLSLRRPIERHVKDVRDALAQALADAFTDVPKDQAIQTIEDVLRSAAFPDAGSAAAEDQQRTVQFFQRLIERLQAA